MLQFIFEANFTIKFNLYVIKNGEQLGKFGFFTTESFNEILDQFPVLEIPDHVIFIGKISKFKELENYYRNLNKEVIIEWQ